MEFCVTLSNILIFIQCTKVIISTGQRINSYSEVLKHLLPDKIRNNRRIFSTRVVVKYSHLSYVLVIRAVKTILTLCIATILTLYDFPFFWY